jgi:hypothetical protein
VFKNESAYDAEYFIHSSLRKFKEYFGADAVVFAVIDKWAKEGFQIHTVISYIVKSTTTNEILFERSCDMTLNLMKNSNYGNGLAGALAGVLADVIVSAIDVATTEHIEAARIANIDANISGIELASNAFESVIPFFPIILSAVAIMFAVSTLISWAYYCQKAWTFLVGEGKKRVLAFNLIYCLFIVIGSAMNVHSVIDITDAFDEKYISARLINVETAIIIKSSSAYSKLDNMNEVINISENIAKELVGTTLTAEEKERQETEKLITKALEDGYIRVGKVDVLLTEFSPATYKEATKLAREYRFKGMAGWRLPNVSEAAMFYNKCCGYYYINYEFPSLYSDYWCLDKHRIYLGESWGVSSSSSKTLSYFLVRDAY